MCNDDFYKETLVYLHIFQLGHLRQIIIPPLFLCNPFKGVFFGALCIGMAGVASLMGSVLQVTYLQPFIALQRPRVFYTTPDRELSVYRQLFPYLA